MRADSAAWDRAAEVRAAAAGWRRASTIDDATFAAIEASFPDPCVTPTWIWRALTACLATAIGLCTLAAVLVATEPRATGLAVFLWLFAAALVIATERMEASPRHARRGAAGATSFWAVVLFLLGLGLLLQEVLRIHMDTAIDAVLLAGVVAWGAGAWRWGSPVFAGLGAVSLFLFLGRMPHARILWGVAGVALAGLAERRLDAPSWAPSPRRAAAVLAVAGVAAVYAALNYYSLDENLLENLRKLVFARAAPRPAVSAFSTVATAVIPLGVLAWGIRSRRTFVIDTGIVLAALSLVTLRHYVHVLPLWAALVVSGAALLALALAVERALRRAPGKERGGFTADPLFSNERRERAIEVVSVATSFTPSAKPTMAEDKGFTGEGGRFGGGGATERF